MIAGNMQQQMKLQSYHSAIWRLRRLLSLSGNCNCWRRTAVEVTVNSLTREITKLVIDEER